MQNKYPGTCKCGAFVDAGDGTVRKINGKWRIACDACSPADRPNATRFELIRVLQRELLGDEIHDPHPILYSSEDDARAAAQEIYAGRGGYTEADLRDLLLIELHKIELRGSRTAMPAGFIECVARAA